LLSALSLLSRERAKKEIGRGRESLHVLGDDAGENHRLETAPTRTTMMETTELGLILLLGADDDVAKTTARLQRQRSCREDFFGPKQSEFGFF